VDALAAAVLEALDPGNQRVAHCLSGATAMVVTDLALARAGKIAVGLRSTDSPSRIQQMVEDAGCSLLVTDLDDLELGPHRALVAVRSPVAPPGPRSPIVGALDRLHLGLHRGDERHRADAPVGLPTSPSGPGPAGPPLRDGTACSSPCPTATPSLTFGVGLAAGVSATVLDLRTTGLKDLPAWIHEHGIDRMLFIPALLQAVLANDPDPRLFAGLRTVGFGSDTATWDDVASVRAHFAPGCHHHQRVRPH
jgi:hypothetical protein